jgi:hypothetical protein
MLSAPLTTAHIYVHDNNLAAHVAVYYWFEALNSSVITSGFMCDDKTVPVPAGAVRIGVNVQDPVSGTLDCLPATGVAPTSGYITVWA